MRGSGDRANVPIKQADCALFHCGKNNLSHNRLQSDSTRCNSLIILIKMPPRCKPQRLHSLLLLWHFCDILDSSRNASIACWVESFTFVGFTELRFIWGLNQSRFRINQTRRYLMAADNPPETRLRVATAQGEERWMKVGVGGGIGGCLTLSERFLRASFSPGEECSWAA